MTDIAHLAAALRDKAADYSSECKRGAYTDAAAQVEQAWHDHAHDGAWERWGQCQPCDRERGILGLTQDPPDDDGHRRP